MSRYVTVKLTEREAAAVEEALRCEIPTRYEANRGLTGERLDTEPDAIDAIVPAMERALAKIEKARHG